MNPLNDCESFCSLAQSPFLWFVNQPYTGFFVESLLKLKHVHGCIKKWSDKKILFDESSLFSIVAVCTLTSGNHVVENAKAGFVCMHSCGVSIQFCLSVRYVRKLILSTNNGPVYGLDQSLYYTCFAYCLYVTDFTDTFIKSIIIGGQ